MRCIVASLSIALVAPGCREKPTPRPASPNILLIVLDTFRADRLGSDGSRRGLTPWLDEFASTATVFHRAYARSSWTRPSVASLLTSLYPSLHGATGILARLPPSVHTLPESLHVHAYETRGWSANTMISTDAGFGRGFDALTALDARYIPYLGDAPVSQDAAEVNRNVAAWIERRQKPGDSQRPAFVYLQYMDTHTPYVPDLETLWRYG